MPRCMLTCFALAACGGTAPRVAEPSAPVATASLVATAPALGPGPAPPPSSTAPPPPEPAPCVPPPADADSRQGAFALAHDYAVLRIYRLDVAGCATLVDTIDTGGPYAFAAVDDAPLGGMPELSVDTWLMHGDRLRKHFSWAGGHYVETGPEEDVPGPSKWSPRHPHSH